MKILHKYRRLIGVILTFTVSVMLLVSIIPASAADLSLEYCSYYPYGQIYTFGDTSVRLYSSANTLYIGSSGNAGSYIFHNGTFGSLGRCYLDSSKSSNFVFSFYGDPSWRSGIESGNFGCVCVFRGNDNKIFANIATINYSVNPVSSSTCLYTFTITPDMQHMALNYVGLSSAYLVGIGIGHKGGYSGNVKFVSFEHSSITSDTDDSVSSDDSKHWYSPLTNFFRTLFANKLNSLKIEFGLLGSLVTGSIESVTNKLSNMLDLLGNITSLIWNGAKPVLKPLYEEVILPSLNSILNAVNVLATKTAEVFSPILADIINFFAPYFNSISNIVTTNFLNLVENLTPLVNKFVTAISPSLDSIVTNISKNISSIFKECFVPSDSSSEYQEFVAMKNDISNKFPIFNQLNSFFTALFNPEVYNITSGGHSYSLLTYFGSFNLSRNTKGFSYFSYVPDVNYLFTFTFNNVATSNSLLILRDYSGKLLRSYPIHNGYNCISFSVPQVINNVEISDFSSNSLSVSDVSLYKLDSVNVPSDFIVNVYGKDVSVLNFDWYLPYKYYGDICVIAFCYLAFVWHTFKRLPSII